MNPSSPAPTFEFQGLMKLVLESGATLHGVDIYELEEINAIREIVADTSEIQITYTGS